MSFKPEYLNSIPTFDGNPTELNRYLAIYKRDQSCLNRDLVMLKQLPHETAQKFYDKCLEILNLLCDLQDRSLIHKFSVRHQFNKMFSNLIQIVNFPNPLQ
ncbi:hypothetical protein HUJ04_003252 [Dendroctonus ponderosae]|nr:hypothetical protein HUJ04_003252 [Dendroctonus ponderosae]